jgi:hypothetical protein
MKYEKREPYLFLARISDLGLCNFCKYGDFEGSWCDADLNCEHPLPIISDNEPGEVWGGNDCWGFKPQHNLQVCGVIASIAMQGMMPYYSRGEYIGVIPKKEVL